MSSSRIIIRSDFTSLGEHTRAKCRVENGMLCNCLLEE